jgi:hypothetical protein
MSVPLMNGRWRQERTMTPPAVTPFIWRNPVRTIASFSSGLVPCHHIGGDWMVVKAIASSGQAFGRKRSPALRIMLGEQIVRFGWA